MGPPAVKMVADSVARLRDGNSVKLREFLKNQLVFDGQKGVDMNFHNSGQLRQPLLIMEHGKIVGEMPTPGTDFDTLKVGEAPWGA
jgi:hypothetical protein